MSEYDTTALLSDVREDGSIPAGDLRFTDALILTAATRELREVLAPMLTNSRAEHLVYPYTQTVVSGTANYRMPPRAVGGSLRSVFYIDESGDQRRLRQISSDAIITRNRNPGTPTSYYVQNYTLVLVPTPNAGGTLSTPYYARPNTLVLPSAAAVAVSPAVPTPGTLTLSIVNPPSALQADTRVDIVRATPGFETLVPNAAATIAEGAPGVYAVIISGLTEDPGVVAGDYVCVAGEAPVAQIPVEMKGLLSIRAAQRLLKRVGDPHWQDLEEDVARLTQAANEFLAPRVAGDTQQAGGIMAENGLVGGLLGGWGIR